MFESNFEKEFRIRLAVLRNNKGVSARDMSLSLGQNPGYVNNIENGKALPSMSMFFHICEYLKISPSEFFENFNYQDTNSKVGELSQALRFLDEAQIDSLHLIASELRVYNRFVN